MSHVKELKREKYILEVRDGMGRERKKKKIWMDSLRDHIFFLFWVRHEFSITGF